MSNEKIHKIIDLCLEAKKKGHDCFLRYSGHIDSLEIQVHLFGWGRECDPEYVSKIKLTKKDADEKLDEVIVYLEDVINADDRGIKLNVFRNKYNLIKMGWKDTNIRDYELSNLLTKIESEFSIPGLKDEAFNAVNTDVMQLYHDVSNERSFIKALRA